MKNFIKAIAVFGITTLILTGCKREAVQPQPDGISKETLNKIYNLGFGTKDVQRHEDGYLVEGDIIITESLLNSVPEQKLLQIANTEQYRTTNLVKALPRNITVALSTNLPASYKAALTEMVRRYNAENLRITFSIVSSSAKITFVTGHGSYLASSGFPSSTGEPYPTVKVNAQFLGSGNGSTTFTNYIATIFAHEVGHCIGFRHTDYKDRSYSCGGSYANEGASTVGAINIPGTPTSAEPKSFMLACISSNQNRPFDSYDKTALAYLY